MTNHTVDARPPGATGGTGRARKLPLVFTGKFISVRACPARRPAGLSGCLGRAGWMMKTNCVIPRRR